MEYNINGTSFITQEMTINSFDNLIKIKNHIKWHESHKLLKVEFPLPLLNHDSQYGTQFGYINRSVTQNTSWEKAK